jgi:hypothetical protein
MMALPKKASGAGLPVGALLIFIGLIGVVGLAVFGAWGLFGMVKLASVPVAGEWQAKGKPWRIELRADKTVVSSTGSVQPDAPQAWTSEPGAYKVDYFGNLWLKLKSGKIYTSILTPPPGAQAPPNPDRFDLIESGTEAVTVFDRVPAKSKPPASP